MAYKDPNDPRSKEAKRRHYEKNKQQYKDNKNRKKAELKAFLQAVKSYPCTDCNTSYPFYVMQFDHLPEYTKERLPAQLCNTGSWIITVEEIMKCEVVCANCHAIRTYNRD